MQSTEREIELSCYDTRALVSTKGAMVKEFSIGGKDIFYPDCVLDIDGVRKRRGGMPLLFPFAGPPPKEGPLSNLPQHGFARNLNWRVKGRDLKDPCSVSLGLESDSETEGIYPGNFSLTAGVSVSEGALTYLLTVQNRSKKPLILAPGFHPYLNVPEKDREKIRTNIPKFETNRFDWAKGQIFPRNSNVKVGEIDIPGLGRVKIDQSGQFRKWMIWSDKEDYVCIEPWVGGVGAVEHPEENLIVERSLNFWIHIKLQSFS